MVQRQTRPRDMRIAGVFSIAFAVLRLSTLDIDAQGSKEVQVKFHSDTDITTVRLAANDGRGRPILNLRAEELAIKVDRKGRAVRFLELVQLSRSASSAVSAPPEQAKAADEGAVVPEHRRWLLFVDETLIPFGDERQSVFSVVRFLGQLPPQDEASVVAVPYGQVDIPFTRNRAAVQQALLAIAGHASRPNQPVGSCEDSLPARLTLLKMKEAIAKVAPLSGGPITAILISGGLAPARSCRAEFDELIQMARERGITFYPVRPYSFVLSAGSGITLKDGAGHRVDLPDVRSANAEGLENLADLTGGRFFDLSGSAEGALRSIEAETSAYYLLGFETDPADLGDQNHRISVQCSRRGVRVTVHESVSMQAKRH